MTKKQRFLKSQKEILKSNDPVEIARHLVTVLNANGYSTRSYDHIADYHAFDIAINEGLDGTLRIQNLAQKWELRENK